MRLPDRVSGRLDAEGVIAQVDEDLASLPGKMLERWAQLCGYPLGAPTQRST
jgi:hypothetical protein